ncbi:MAG: hypothetical protein KAJ46_06900 [Sedimentisphaerales bacterium]|nr:hypothetical protein [Sedimentisphaerales bacterium]
MYKDDDCKAKQTKSIIRICIIIPFLSCGCINIKYMSYIKVQMSPKDRATIVDGELGDTQKLWQKLQLPHQSQRDKYLIIMQILHHFTSQIGSDDYVMIGEICGNGNAYVSLDKVKRAVCKRSAKEGGDLVLICNSGVSSKDYSYTTPGRSTTNIYGTVYGGPGYASGHARGSTIYTPPKTHSGTHYFPYVKGIVLRYVSGIENFRKDVARLNDDEFKKYIEKSEIIFKTPKITYDEAILQMKKILGEFKH